MRNGDTDSVSLKMRKRDDSKDADVTMPTPDTPPVVFLWRLARHITPTVSIGRGTTYYFHAECLSHDTTYFRMSARTFGSML